MPADSEAAPVSLPHTFRPLGVRLAVYVLGGVLALFMVVIWFAFSADVRAQFTILQRLTLLGLAATLGAGGYALARSRLVARADGLTVVNGYRSRRYEWSEVVAVRLRPGSPWATLDLGDGTTVAAMGIQGSDGPRAVRQVRQLRAIVDRLTSTERND
jgi:hypothetical protein